MNKLIFRSLGQHPEYKEELLNKVKHNSDWSFLYGWLLDRFDELGTDMLPQIYAAFDEKENMVGYYVLSAKEMIKHDQNMKPWLGIILVFDEYRGKKYSPLMIERACETAKNLGFECLYLITEHDNYYERFGFEFVKEEHYENGERTKLYKQIFNDR